MAHKIEVFSNKEEASSNMGGSHLQYCMDVSYQKLVALFGIPHLFDDYKTDAEWCVRFNGEILTIYNYKTGKNYCGADGQETEEITDWHIGGTNKEVAEQFARKIQAFEVSILKPIVVKV